MAKTILIPTDFCVESLNTLRLALRHYEDESVNVVLMYAEELSDSITELLFYNPEKTIKNLKTAEFDEALSIIKNRYETIINSVSYEVFNGHNTNAMSSFIESKAVDMIFIPKSYRFHFPKNGFNPTSLIKKTKLPFQEIEWGNDKNINEEVPLNAFF